MSPTDIDLCACDTMLPSFQCRGFGQTGDSVFRDGVWERVWTWSVRGQRSVVDDPSWVYLRSENTNTHIEKLTAWGFLYLEDSESLTGANHSTSHVHIHYGPEGFD